MQADVRNRIRGGGLDIVSPADSNEQRREQGGFKASWQISGEKPGVPAPSHLKEVGFKSENFEELTRREFQAEGTV